MTPYTWTEKKRSLYLIPQWWFNHIVLQSIIVGKAVDMSITQHWDCLRGINIWFSVLELFHNIKRCWCLRGFMFSQTAKYNEHVHLYNSLYHLNRMPSMPWFDIIDVDVTDHESFSQNLFPHHTVLPTVSQFSNTEYVEMILHLTLYLSTNFCS